MSKRDFTVIYYFWNGLLQIILINVPKVWLNLDSIDGFEFDFCVRTLHASKCPGAELYPGQRPRECRWLDQ